MTKDQLVAKQGNCVSFFYFYFVVVSLNILSSYINRYFFVHLLSSYSYWSFLPSFLRSFVPSFLRSFVPSFPISLVSFCFKDGSLRRNYAKNRIGGHVSCSFTSLMIYQSCLLPLLPPLRRGQKLTTTKRARSTKSMC